MRLVYTNNAQPVAVGDTLLIDGVEHRVDYFRPPAHAGSSGKVIVRKVGEHHGSREYYVSVIGAKWIEEGAALVRVQQ